MSKAEIEEREKAEKKKETLWKMIEKEKQREEPDSGKIDILLEIMDRLNKETEKQEAGGKESAK